jgi:hypothetical protein
VSSNSSPHLLVDIDGVVNALLTEGSDWDHVFQIRTKDGRGPFTIRVPTGTRERLERLEREFDMVWASTWMDQAATLLCPRLGIGAGWPYVDLTREVELVSTGIWETDTWKLPGVDRWAADTFRPLAWIDDDVGDDARSWAEKRTALIAPTIVLETDPGSGLTDDEVATALDWARSLA